MAEILTKYYENRDELQAAGEWCRSRINEHQFTWPFIADKMLRIVHKVLNEQPGEPVFKGFGTPARIN
jgi:hypothetical protein